MICIGTDDLTSLRAFELAPDLLLANSMQFETTRGKKQTKWQPLFWPEYYAKEGHDMTVAGNTLKETKMEQYAKRVSKLRKAQREMAI